MAAATGDGKQTHVSRGATSEQSSRSPQEAMKSMLSESACTPLTAGAQDHEEGI